MTEAATTEQSTLRAYGVLFIGVIAVSMAAILIRLGQGQDVSSLLIAAGRLTLAALILTPSALRNPRFMAQIRALSRRDMLLIGISGLFLAIHFATWVTSLEYTTVLISVVLVTTTPLWVALLEIFVLRASLTRGVIVGLIIVLSGSLIIGVSGEPEVADSGNQMIEGGILALIGAMAAAVYLTIGRNLRPRLSLIPYIWLVYGCAALILLGAVIVSGISITGYGFEGYLWVIALALVPQLIGHSSLNYALAYLPATLVSIATQAEPIGGAILALFIFSEVPGSWQVFGSIVILAGVTLTTLSQSKD